MESCQLNLYKRAVPPTVDCAAARQKVACIRCPLSSVDPRVVVCIMCSLSSIDHGATD